MLLPTSGARVPLQPTQVVGSSTGGAIAQYMALNHPHTNARFDAFTHREFEIRRER